MMRETGVQIGNSGLSLDIEELDDRRFAIKEIRWPIRSRAAAYFAG